MDSQAYVPKEDRYGSQEELIAALKLAIAENAANAQKKGNYQYSVTINVDELLAGRLPADYLDYIGRYTYEDSVAQMVTTTEKLLDIAAIPMPKAGRLSGTTSGTSVTFKLSGDSDPTYIQMRDATTNKLVVSCFVLTGKNVSIKVPQGEYVIVWASGPYWYGENQLFGNMSVMNKSEQTEILGSRYKHTFTLEKSEDGDVSYYDADLSDFQ